MTSPNFGAMIKSTLKRRGNFTDDPGLGGEMSTSNNFHLKHLVPKQQKCC